ncbi:hypothetical protein BDN70DRAFT_867447 [Pholiota conissans]|uniref:DUF7726 domain-containing protein n=1 Tax=Pholiota conissans TaxID=109636 RepID=A0A9P5YQT0_9AGAR|nr:hypothetical protein BDN70DRAFT_867447 [Pholiota conissans]
MAPKRKSDAMESAPAEAKASAPKKARVSDASDASDAPTDAKASKKPQSWKDIKLEKEDEGAVPIYDDCGEIRRKIKLLQQTPGWKASPWLKEIGGINSNSYNRFMKESGKNDGAANGTYYAAYIYFEKVRILENKKKTAKRLENEKQNPSGFPRENRRYAWVRA